MKKKVALVTGASRGIGRQISLTLAKEGMFVIVNYCGSEARAKGVLEEIRDWFGEDGVRLRSFAMMPLRTDRTIGLLVLASEESQRFYPEMGTIYLAQLGELASAAIRRFASA